MQLFWAVALSVFGGDPERFLIASSPRLKAVQYRRLPDGPLQPLITSLTEPEGMVINGTTLYVADPGQRSVFAYELLVHGSHLIALQERKVVTNVESHWVSFGENLIVSDVAANKIESASVSETGSLPMALKPVYSGGESGTSTHVSAPGGVASAGGSGTIYWVNTEAGKKKGSLMVGDLADGKVEVLAKSTETAYGICLTTHNIFFTADSKSLYGVLRTGSPEPVEISSSLVQPRGLAFDGDGTVFVADKMQGKILSFPGNINNLMATDLQDAGEVPDVYGLAVFVHDPDLDPKPTILQEGLADIKSFLSRAR
jgi:sugar lactone lactonase YvrE